MLKRAWLPKSLALFILFSVFEFPTIEVSSAATPIALNVQSVAQGSPGSASFTGNLTASVTTTAANTILIAYVAWEGSDLSGANNPLTSVIDNGSTGLIWNKRISYYNGNAQSQEIWWAVAPTVGTYGVKASWTNTLVDDSTLNLMAFSGVDLSSPWDSTTSVTLPGTLFGTFSTTKANTYLLGFYGNEWPSVPSSPIPSGTVTQISYVDNNGARWYQYSHVIGGAVASIQNNITLGWAAQSDTSRLSTSFLILDALKAAGQNTPISINSIAQAVKNQTTNIVFSLPSTAGKVSVYANRRPVARCFNISVGAVSNFTCSWKPTSIGLVNLYATFQETGSPSISSTTPVVNVMVGNRSVPR